MGRIRYTLITGAVAALAVATFGAAPASAGVDPTLNNPAHYGANCTKVEYVDGTKTYFVPANTTVYIKAGTVVYPFSGGATGQTVTLPKDISFVITCPPVVYPPS
jgi:hypothetical protein